jgi:hypothetical protein
MSTVAATKPAPVNRFVLGSKSFAAISAVEGLKLSSVSQQRLARTAALPQAERRALTISAFSSARKRG